MNEAPPPSPIIAGPVRAISPPQEDAAPPPPATRVVRAEPPDRPSGADVFGDRRDDGPSEVASRETSPVSGRAGVEPCPASGAPAAAAPVAAVQFVARWEEDGGAADAAFAPHDEAPLPRNGVFIPAAPVGPVADVMAFSLPLARGLLAEHATVTLGAVERAVNALAHPLRAAEGGPAGALYWLGFSSWVVAAALAAEGARRSWQRRPGLVAAPAAGLPPEGEP